MVAAQFNQTQGVPDAMTYEQDTDGQDASDLAGEYALGLLEGPERAAFETQLETSSELRENVARWQEHFAALGMDVDEVAPPATLLSHLKRELWGENKLPWRRRIRIWEYGVGGMLAALLVFFVYNLTDFTTQTTPVLQAQIENSDGQLQVALALGEGTGLLRIKYSGPEPKAGRSYELWAIADGNTPVSLGVLPLERVAALRLSDQQAALVRVGVTLALSDEPSGGSPTGTPTGAVLGAGAVQVFTNL